LKPVPGIQIVGGDKIIKDCSTRKFPSFRKKRKTNKQNKKNQQKKLCRGLNPLKKSCTGKGREKKIMQAEKVPPPITFLMVRPLQVKIKGD